MQHLETQWSRLATLWIRTGGRNGVDPEAAYPEESAMIEMLNAVTVVTADMVHSYAFYDALGFVAVLGGPDAPFTTYGAGDGFLNVQYDPERAPVASIWGRMIFWVTDVDALYAQARAHGYEPEMAPTDAPWGERYFHLRDPDGHELSFARPLGR